MTMTIRIVLGVLAVLLVGPVVAQDALAVDADGEVFAYLVALQSGVAQGGESNIGEQRKYCHRAVCSARRGPGHSLGQHWYGPKRIATSGREAYVAAARDRDAHRRAARGHDVGVLGCIAR